MKLLEPRKDIFYLVSKYSDYFSRLESEALLSHALKCARGDLYTKDLVINDGIESTYDSLAKRRLAGEPLQYITGIAEFMGMDFIADKEVFIPRPETEVLVEEVFRHASQSVKILDLCTGSGNIAVSLAKSLPCAEIIATDISERALDIARKNASLHNIDGRIEFYNGDLFGALRFDIKYKFDIIVSNPPYIKRADVEFLQEEVKREPVISLDGGADGLDFYRRMACDAAPYLNREGFLFLETGAGQAKSVKEIFESNEIFAARKIINDFAGIERVLWISLS